MTVPNGFDRTLSDWLSGENAPDVPDWVYEGAFVEARTTGQSRAMPDALTRWLRAREMLPGPRPLGLGRRPSFAAPAIMIVALVIVAMVSAVLLVGASRLAPDRLFTTNRFHASGSIDEPGAALPGTLIALPDGRALVTNGVNLDLFDPATGQFVRASDRLSVPRFGESATLLRDGTVLIVGGGDADRVVPASSGSPAEIFDPATGSVTLLGPTLEPHVDGSATLLADGRVLLAGGDPSGRSTTFAELYDPATQTFRRTTSQTQAASFSRAIPLDDGRVLVGGGGREVALEIYDPATDRFSPAGLLANNVLDASATALDDGRVLVVGGSTWDPERNEGAISDAVQVYDPATNSFALAGRLPAPRLGHAAVLLDSGDVLVMGGATEPEADTRTRGDPSGSWCYTCRKTVPLTDALIWKRETGEFVPAGSMTRSRAHFLATRLQGGRVLVIGHYPWHPSDGPLPVPDEQELQTTLSAEVFE
jgi:hypothetical protein